MNGVASSVRLSDVVYDLEERVNVGVKLNSRKLRGGPEYRLVTRFLRSRSLQLHHGEQATVLLEPELPTGYPDILVIVWDSAVYERRAVQSILLDELSLRVLTLVQFSKNATLDTVVLHFPKGGLRRAMALLESGLIVNEGLNGTLSCSLEDVGIRRVVAIEAKIGKARAAVAQAVKNKIFATESYVLLDHCPQSNILRWAEDLGIGVLVLGDNNTIVQILAASNRPIHVSVAAWQLDEWIRVRSLPDEVLQCQLT